MAKLQPMSEKPIFQKRFVVTTPLELSYMQSKIQENLVNILVYLVFNGSLLQKINLRENGGRLK